MPMPKKTIPDFADEQAEQAFWSEHDSTDYVNWEQAERVMLPNLKSSNPNDFRAFARQELTHSS